MTREESAARTRGKLLDAAVDVFAEKGFGGAALDDIAERAGYTRGALYANFADKEDLFMSVFDRELDSARAEVRVALGTIDSPQQGLEVLAAHVRADAPRSRRMFLLMSEFRVFAVRNVKARQRLARYEQESRALTEEAITSVLGTTALPGPLVAMITQALDNGFWALHFVDPKAVTVETYLEAINLLVRALTALQLEAEPHQQKVG